MRKSTLVGGIAAALASMVLVLPPPGASAAPGDTPGSIFSDLFLILRTENGVPIPSEEFTTVEGPVECVQPISYTEIPGISPTVNPVDGQHVWLVPLVGELDSTALSVAAVEDEDEAEPCDPQAA